MENRFVPEPSERGAFVLVVEDNEWNAKNFSKVIARCGVATPRVASTVRAGAEFLRSFQGAPSVFRRLCGAILDVGLPDGSGLDLVAVAREVAEDVPILVLTANLLPEFANAAQRLGVEFAYKLEEADAIRSFLVRVDARDREPRALATFAIEYGLTATEIEIVLLSLQGYASNEIEEKLAITGATRKTHVHNMLGRCHRSSLVAVCEGVRRGGARRRGLTARPPSLRPA